MTHFTELIPGLPDDMGLECLTLLNYTSHWVAARVSRRWRQVIQSQEFHTHRKRTRRTSKLACLIQSIPENQELDQTKPFRTLKFGLSVFDPVNETWGWIDPIPGFLNGVPLYCRVVGLEGRVAVLGGWDPETYETLKGVFVYEFKTRKWCRVEDMPDNRSFFAVGEVDGRIVVAGGHGENKNALSSAWEYNPKVDEWTELGGMSQGRDECQGIVIGSQFWVVSGYQTDRQGMFDGSADVMQRGSAGWIRLDNTWRANRSPQSLGSDRTGNLFSWEDSDPTVKIGCCGIQSDEFAVVTGSSGHGSPREFFVVHEHGRKWKKLETPKQFGGFVQSGCWVQV